MSKQILSKDYVYELIACCLKNKKVLAICATHLKYEYLATEAQKRVVKYIIDTFTLTGLAPSFGQIAQMYSSNEEIISFLAKVKKIKIAEGQEDGVLNTFSDYIKDVRFQQMYEKQAKMYNEGKTEEALQFTQKEATEIVNFNIKAKSFVEVFDQFDERMKQREIKANSDDTALLEKCTTGIHEFDHLMKGGFRKGTSFLGMARSGVGKSTYLRWIALCNARLGKKVVYFQNESTEDEAMTSIDSAWTGITSDDLEMGEIPEDQLPKILRVRDEIRRRGGKIFVIATEKFGRETIEECNERIDEIEKVYGPIDMALWDYLEIYTTKGNWGKNQDGERKRREDIGEKITAVATSRNICTGTMTQAMDVKKELIDLPDFVLTRNDASEFKNVIKPFSYFFTMNATSDEYNNQWLRIYLDKIRKHAGNRVIKIVQARESGRFYNAAATKTQFYDYNAVNIR
jgi:hypothetical protein